MSRKKVVHDPDSILAEVISAIGDKPSVSWDDYPEHKQAGVWSRKEKDGTEMLFVDKEVLRPVISKFGQLNMNRAILGADLVERGCRDTPCLQVKAKNSQVRIIVYAFYTQKLGDKLVELAKKAKIENSDQNSQ